MKQAVIEERENNLQYFAAKNETIKTAKTNIKALKFERKTHYLNLSLDEKKTYKKWKNMRARKDSTRKD